MDSRDSLIHAETFLSEEEFLLQNQSLNTMSQKELKELQSNILSPYEKELFNRVIQTLETAKKDHARANLNIPKVFDSDTTYYNDLDENLSHLFSQHKSSFIPISEFDKLCTEERMKILRYKEIEHITEQTLKAGKRTDKIALNLEVPLVSDPDTTYYDIFKKEVLKTLEMERDSTLLPIDYDKKLTQIRVNITRDMYKDLPGDDIFFQRISTRKGVNMKPIQDALRIPKGRSVMSEDLHQEDSLTKKERVELLKKYIKETLFTPLDINNIPEDRTIDGISVRSFIKNKNIRHNYDLIFAIANKYALKPEIFFTIFYQESRFNPLTLSNTYASGLGQGTSRYFYNASKKSRINPFNPTETIIRSGKFLSDIQSTLKTIKKKSPSLNEILSAYSSAGFRYYNQEYVRSAHDKFKTFLSLLSQVEPRAVGKNKKLKPLQ